MVTIFHIKTILCGTQKEYILLKRWKMRMREENRAEEGKMYVGNVMRIAAHNITNVM